jgi:hypothetical protein
MPKPPDAASVPVYSSDHEWLVRTAREAGLSDAQILAKVTSGRVRADRLKLIREWARDLGLTEAEALDIARKAAIVT